jgi:hypothetical protein
MTAPLAILFIALQIADIYTTLELLDRVKGAREQNKAMAMLFDEFGPLPTLLVTKGIAILLVAIFLLDEAWWYLAALDAFYVWVVLHNFRQLK